MEKLRSAPAPEIGAIAGIVLFLAGTGSAIWSLLQWGAVGFGPLPSGAMLRQISLSTILMMAGGIVTMTAFIIGFLGLPTRSERR